MEELIRTNDLVIISFVEALLKEADIDYFVADQAMSALEGMVGAFPRRVLIDADDADRARRLIVDAGPATGHLGGRYAPGGGDQCCCGGRVPDAHVAEDQQVGARGDLLRGDDRAGCQRLLDLGQTQRGFAGGNISANSLDDGVEHGCRTHASPIPSDAAD